MYQVLLIAVAPAIALGLGVYLTDRFDREPPKLLIKAFLLGCIIVIPVIIMEIILQMFGFFSSNILRAGYMAFVVAGFSEELFKNKVVYKFFFYREEFNEKLDGIVYSVFVSLGFATIENIMYLLNYSQMNDIGLYRGVFSVPAHALFAVTMGYYFSLAKFCNDVDKKNRYMLRSLWVPVFLHGVFDFILMSGNQFLMYFFVPFVVYLWLNNLRKLNGYFHESKIAFLEQKNNADIDKEID